MKERPMLMSGPMVRAILEGRKTQTRRICSHRYGIGFLGGQGQKDDPECWGYSFDGPDHHGYVVLARGLNERHNHGCISMPCPYGEPGERLWVRETWFDDMPGDAPMLEDGRILYRADHDCRSFEAGCPCNPDGDGKRSEWRSPRFMPRWASRLTLEVTDARVERLQDISEEDAVAEGVARDVPGCVRGARTAFASLWDTINGKRALWASNPFVWAISFRRVA